MIAPYSWFPSSAWEPKSPKLRFVGSTAKQSFANVRAQAELGHERFRGDSMTILDRFSLKGRVALVTAGAGPLFGRSISSALAEAGASVVTVSRSRERNEAFAAEMRTRGHDVHGMALDLEDLASIERLHWAVQRQ